MKATGDQPAISDLTRLECRVKPIRLGDRRHARPYGSVLDSIRRRASVLVVGSLRSSVHDRAVHHFKLGDAIHLAAAVEKRLWIVPDERLPFSKVSDIRIEVLT